MTFKAALPLVALAIVTAIALAIPGVASAQMMSPGFSPNLQSLEQAGAASANTGNKSPSQVLKEAKHKFSDADPRVRVSGLEELRYVDLPAANTVLMRGLNDPDVRVRIKAIDVLGARGVAAAVPEMIQDLYLNDTPPVEKLHIVAALGRIGDSRGTLAIVDYLKSSHSVANRGTAIFALGEIGDPRANGILMQELGDENSPILRKLAREALEKIDGELPSHQQEVIAEERARKYETTDEKLAKLRKLEAEIQAQKY